MLQELLRACGISLLACGIGWLLRHLGHNRRWRWLLLLLALSPTLLISHAYARTAAHALASGGGETFYSLMLAARLAASAAIILALLPAGLTREAWHCAGRLSWRNKVALLLRAESRPLLAALALTFIAAWTDFELASLWSIKTWPVRAFDAQVGSGGLVSALNITAWLPASLAVLLLARTFSPAPRAAAAATPQTSALIAKILGVSLAGLLAVWPLGKITVLGVASLPSALTSQTLLRDLAASAGFSLAAAGLAWIAAKNKLSGVLYLPGLLGGIVIALPVGAAARTLGLGETPLPLILTLTALVLPWAFVLRRLLAREDAALHIARQAAARTVWWRMAGRPSATAIGLIFIAAWNDFTASSLLAPLGFTPVFARLHQLAHYGESSALSAMLLIATATPLLIAASALGIIHLSLKGK